MTIYAEVIGDPIAQSKSPAIHRFWLNALGLEGDYGATRVLPTGLEEYFANRRADPDWRGCNVTAPLKADVIPFLDKIDPAAEKIGAVNCIYPDGEALTGLNTDVDGIAEALADAKMKGEKAVLIGAGGAARAAASFLGRSGAKPIVILARNPGKAIGLMELSGPATTTTSLENAASAIEGAGLVINASTLGMVGADPMPQELIDALGSVAQGATVFDMVTTPARTAFGDAAEARGLGAVDGLVMLVGQARRAFELFFGAEPAREQDAALRDLLLSV